MKTANGVFVFPKLAMAITLAMLVATSGCFLREDKVPAQNPPPAFTVKQPGSNTNLVITPFGSAMGRVFSVNTQAKFVVVTFPIGQLPANDARFSVFHAGMKVGEIKITIPPAPLENGISADIIAGSAQEGDEVRAE